MVETRLVRELITLEALEQGVDPRLALAVATQESYLNPGAVGDNGKSLGLFQLQRAAAIDAGIDPARRGDLALNVQGGVTYLKQKLQQSGGNVEQALSRYNRGTPTYRGIGDPRYVENVMDHYQRQPAGMRPGRLAQVVKAITPASAEAAPPTGPPGAERRPQPMPQAQPRASQESMREELRRIEALEAREEELRRLEAVDQPSAAAPAETFPPLADQEAASTQKALTGQLPQGYSPSTGFAAPAQAPAPAQPPGTDPRAGYEVDVIPGGTPAAPQPPSMGQRLGQAAETALKGVPIAGQLYPLVKPVLQAQYGEHLEQLPRMGAAGAISTTGAMLGTAAGTLAAPFTGPLAPAMPLVGEMAGSYLSRQLNVALGLEEPGVMGDVASVALPGLFGLRRTVQGFRQAPGPALPMVPRGREQMAAEAQAADVPLSYGEIMEQPVVKRAEVALEQVPFVGSAGARRRQQEAVTRAANTEATFRRDQMLHTPWRGLGEVQQAAQQGNRQAQQVLDDMHRAGEDWPRIVQASGNLRAYRARQVANRLYARAGDLAQGLGYIEPARSTQVLDTVLQELDNAVVPDPGTRNLFEQMRQRLLAQPRTYQQMRQFDSDVGDMVRDYYQGKNAVVGAKGVGSVARLRTAIREDMDTFAQQSGVPELQEAVRRANRFYQRTVIPYEDRALAQALQSETPDEIYRAFIQRDHRDRAQNFYTALDQRGRAAVQYGMVTEAMEKAIQPTTGLFSPAKFAGELERIRAARGVFFRGQDAWQLDGLMRVMRAAERAGQFVENPPTGQRLIPWLVAGGAASGVVGPGSLAVSAATARGLSWLLTSPTGSRLLLRAHRIGEDTVAMQNVLRQIGTQGARVLATEATEGVQEGTAVEVQPGRVGR